MSERVNQTESANEDSSISDAGTEGTVDRLALLEEENEQLREKIERIESELEQNNETSGDFSGSVSRRALLGTLGVGGLLGIASSGASAQTGSTLETGGSYSTTSGHGIELTEASTAGFAYGVRGIANSPKGRGVYGEASSSTGNTYGLWGRALSDQGVGLSGTATNSTGSTIGVGGFAHSPNGVAVRGLNFASSGNAYGIRGETSSSEGYGIYTPDDAKVDQNLEVGGDLQVTGTKNFVQAVETKSGTKQVTYHAVEAGRAHTEVNGTAEIVNGKAVVELPDHFQMVTSNNEDVTVQVTPYANESVNPQVVERSPSEIVVRDFGDGHKDYTFAYTVNGVREGFEDREAIGDSG